MSHPKGAAAEAIDQEGDVITVLLKQHDRIRRLFTEVKDAQGETKQQAYDELRALLAAHETAEEMILRPVSSKDAGAKVADARNQEEAEATRMLTDLEKIDTSSPAFDAAFAELEQAVLDHAEREERDEFPPVRAREEQDRLMSMGEALKATEKVAPTHPHPSTAGSPAAQWAAGPFASLVDRARDAIKESMPGG